MEARGLQDEYVADLARLEAGSQPIAPGSQVTDHGLDLASPVIGPDTDGDYYPFFLSPTEVLFSSDRAGSMELYRAVLDTGAVVKVQEDPVGAIAGTSDGTSSPEQPFPPDPTSIFRARWRGIRPRSWSPPGPRFAEERAAFGAGSFQVDQSVYVGGDLTIELVCGYIDLPLGIGLAARVDRITPSSFSPANDLGAYVFLGFDSFSAFAQHGVSARVQAQRWEPVRSSAAPRAPRRSFTASHPRGIIEACPGKRSSWWKTSHPWLAASSMD